jgi:hypothetical protein
MNDNLTKDIATLAKEKHGDNWLAYLWGASQVLLNEKDLQMILELLEEN